MRPGVEVISRAQPLPRSAPTDTGMAFMIGATEKGGTTPLLVRSITEYESALGIRAGYEAAYDAADAYFREGGSRLTVSRLNPGVVFAAPEASGGISEESLAGMRRDDLDALAAERGIEDAASLPNREAVVEAILAGVSTAEQESASVAEQYEEALLAVDPTIAAALAALTKDFGPGQVFVADSLLAGTIDTQTALLAHAQATNRVALLETPDGTAAAITAAAAAVRALASARYGAIFAPAAIVPGLATGTTRTVPYPAIEAGIISRNDASFNPNVPAAGDRGQALYALDLTARYTDAEYEALNEAGVCMARLVYDGVRTYGYRTPVDPATPAGVWLSLGYARLNMAITAKAEAIGEHYVFTQIDGRRRTIADFGSELRAMLVPYWESGALYGNTADEAFNVEVGSAVNTEETIANGELHAVISVRMSPFAEWVVIEIVKVATTQALAA